MYIYIYIYIYILEKDPCHNDTAISTSLESILHRDKIVPMRCLGHPKSTQKVVPGAFWGPPGRSRSSLG